MININKSMDNISTRILIILMVPLNTPSKPLYLEMSLLNMEMVDMCEMYGEHFLHNTY